MFDSEHGDSLEEWSRFEHDPVVSHLFILDPWIRTQGLVTNAQIFRTSELTGKTTSNGRPVRACVCACVRACMRASNRNLARSSQQALTGVETVIMHCSFVCGSDAEKLMEISYFG